MVENKDFDMGSYDGNDLRQPLMMQGTAPPEYEVVLGADAVETIMEKDVSGSSSSSPSSTAAAASTSTTTTTTLAEQQKVGAGVAGGVVGLLLGGPLLGMLLGLGSAYATSREGAAGDAARALGDVALVARAKARQVNDKHHLVDRSKAAAADAYEKIRELDRRHDVLQRTTDFVVYSWESLKEINRQHRLVERAIEGVGRAIAFVARKILEQANRPQEGSRSEHGNTDAACTNRRNSAVF